MVLTNHNPWNHKIYSARDITFKETQKQWYTPSYFLTPGPPLATFFFFFGSDAWRPLPGDQSFCIKSPLDSYTDQNVTLHHN